MSRPALPSHGGNGNDNYIAHGDAAAIRTFSDSEALYVNASGDTLPERWMPEQQSGSERVFLGTARYLRYGGKIRMEPVVGSANKYEYCPSGGGHGLL
jgi:hypothetical protein